MQERLWQGQFIRGHKQAPTQSLVKVGIAQHDQPDKLQLGGLFSLKTTNALAREIHN